MKDLLPKEKHSKTPLPTGAKVAIGIAVWILGGFVIVEPAFIIVLASVVTAIVVLGRKSSQKTQVKKPSTAATTAVRVSMESVPFVSGGLQSQRSINIEMASEKRMFRKDRRFRRDLRYISKSDAAARGLFNHFLQNEVIASALKSKELPTLRIVGRHTSGGVEISGSVKRRANGLLVLTVSRRQMTPSTMLHELAHYASDLDAGHSTTWATTYENFVKAAYPGRASWQFAAA